MQEGESTINHQLVDQCLDKEGYISSDVGYYLMMGFKSENTKSVYRYLPRDENGHREVVKKREFDGIEPVANPRAHYRIGQKAGAVMV